MDAHPSLNLQQGRFLDQWFSKCDGPWTNSISITRKLTRKANSQTPSCLLGSERKREGGSNLFLNSPLGVHDSGWSLLILPLYACHTYIRTNHWQWSHTLFLLMYPVLLLLHSTPLSLKFKFKKKEKRKRKYLKTIDQINFVPVVSVC